MDGIPTIYLLDLEEIQEKTERPVPVSSMWTHSVTRRCLRSTLGCLLIYFSSVTFCQQAAELYSTKSKKV